jgi:type IV fimbrial biogenesis protein FimT
VSLFSTGARIAPPPGRIIGGRLKGAGKSAETTVKDCIHMFSSQKRLIGNSRGFSIAEIIVAVAVFSILAAIAIPQFVAFRPKNRLNGATRQIYSQLMWARSKAVTDNSSYVVTFPTNQTMLITGSTTRTVNIQSDYVDVTLSSTATTITFSSRGTSDVSPTITLTNSGGSKTVSLKITGAATIS